MSPFWSRFLTEHWQRGPVAFRQPFADRLASPDEIFRGLLSLGERLRAGDRRIDFRFMRSGVPPDDPEPYLPRAADGSTAAYTRRMQAELGGDDFGIIVNDLQALVPPVWDRILGFLHGLYEHTGVRGSAIIDLFMGDYRRTYLGLHKDSQDVFTFVVEGKKTALLWPFEVFAPHAPKATREQPFELRGVDYGPMRHSAIVLTAEPGDLLYWPASFWHVIEGDGTLVSTLSLGLFLHDDPLAKMAVVAGDETAADMVPVVPASPLLRGVRRVIAQPVLQRALEERLLARRTGYGFKQAPDPVDTPPPSEKTPLRLSRPEALAWMIHDDGTLSWSVQGRVFPAPPSVLPLLEALAAGEARSPRQIARLGSDAEVVLAMLLRQRLLS